MHNKRIICMGLSLIMTATALLGCGGSTGAATASEPQAAEAQAEGAEENAEAAEENAEGAEENAEAADAAGAQGEAAEGTAADNAAAAAGEEIAPEDISVTWEDSRVYDGLTLGRYNTVTTYGVKGYEDVPFIRVSDYMNFICDGKQRSVMENGVMKISINGAEITVDPAAAHEGSRLVGVHLSVGAGHEREKLHFGYMRVGGMIKKVEYIHSY